MLPFAISWPSVYPMIQNSPNLQTAMPCFPFYTLPVQIMIPSTFEGNLPTNENQQLEKKIEEQHQSEIRLEEKQVNRKRSQNKYRNILTNITNLILNFIVCPKKASELLFRIDSQLTEKDETMFYQYVKDMKKYFCSYYNPTKLKTLFRGSTLPKYKADFHRIFRLAAKIILQEKIPQCLMTSKKISQQLKKDHFCARRIILSILKYGSAPNQNIYSTSV